MIIQAGNTGFDFTILLVTSCMDYLLSNTKSSIQNRLTRKDNSKGGKVTKADRIKRRSYVHAFLDKGYSIAQIASTKINGKKLGSIETISKDVDIILEKMTSKNIIIDDCTLDVSPLNIEKAKFDYEFTIKPLDVDTDKFDIEFLTKNRV